MNNKEKVLVEIFILLGFGVAALVISMTSGTAALAQDQNPSATGKQHQTSHLLLVLIYQQHLLAIQQQV